MAAEIEGKTSRKAHIFPADLSEPNAARALFADAAKAGLTIDVLINNAGFGLLGKFWELPDHEQMQMVQLNIGALTQLTRLVLPGMIDRRTGYILNVASTAAFQPGPLMAIYYASKAYVVSFSEAIHNEAKEFGVKVCCVCPGVTARSSTSVPACRNSIVSRRPYNECRGSSENRLESDENREDTWW